MQKLADISAFERLGVNNTISDCSVFNSFKLDVEIENWDDFKRFILGQSPGDWKAYRFEVIDALSDEAKDECFLYMDSLFSKRNARESYGDFMNRNMKVILAIVGQIEYQESEHYTREDVMDWDGI